MKSECIEWTRGKLPRGYGQLRLGKKMYLAHRLAYVIFVGPLKQTDLVCHKCDNPSCINPAHLFVGTQKDNMRDASRKGRCHEQRKTHCKNGHEYTPENTLRYKAHGGRQCRKCHAVCVAAYYRKTKQRKEKSKCRTS